MLKFDDSVPVANTDKDNVIADGIFTCHIEFKTFKHSGRQSVRQISVLKQITSEDHLLNGGSQIPSIVPEVEMSREQLWRLILPSGVNSGQEAIWCDDSDNRPKASMMMTRSGSSFKKFWRKHQNSGDEISRVQTRQTMQTHWGGMQGDGCRWRLGLARKGSSDYFCVPYATHFRNEAFHNVSRICRRKRSIGFVSFICFVCCLLGTLLGRSSRDLHDNLPCKADLQGNLPRRSFSCFRHRGQVRKSQGVNKKKNCWHDWCHPLSCPFENESRSQFRTRAANLAFQVCRLLHNGVVEFITQLVCKGPIYLFRSSEWLARSQIGSWACLRKIYGHAPFWFQPRSVFGWLQTELAWQPCIVFGLCVTLPAARITLLEPRKKATEMFEPMESHGIAWAKKHTHTHTHI